VYINSLSGRIQIDKESLYLTSVHFKPAKLSLRILVDFHLTFFGTQHPLECPLKSFFSISTVPQARLSPLHTLTLRMQALFVQADREELHKAIARPGAVRAGERGEGARVAALPKLRGRKGRVESVVEGWRMMPWSLDRSRGYATHIHTHYHHYYYCSNRHPRPAATTEHWLTTPSQTYTHTYMNCSPCVICTLRQRVVATRSSVSRVCADSCIDIKCTRPGG